MREKEILKKLKKLFFKRNFYEKSAANFESIIKWNKNKNKSKKCRIIGKNEGFFKIEILNSTTLR